MSKILPTFFLSIVAFVNLQAVTLYWKGDTTDASVLSNWYSDADFTAQAAALPADGDDIILGENAGSMVWKLNDVTPGSWTQTTEYTNTVTFYTGRKNGMTTTLYGVTDDSGESRVFRVSGDCTLLGGKWTHPAQPSFKNLTGTAAYKEGYGVYHIIAEVGGDMTVGAAFAATAYAKGFPSGSNGGPGRGSGNCSSSHAGWGGRSDGTVYAPYGTIRMPKTIGSSHRRAGGGCIEIVVTGTLSLEEGSSFSSDAEQSDYYSGAGGSISIVAGSISGAGSFSARGGNITTRKHGGGGGGGRISIILTDDDADFSGFQGTYSTHHTAGSATTKQDGSGGTTYLETAADGVGGGTLMVDGSRLAYSARMLSKGTVLRGDDAAFPLSKIVLRDNASLVITNAAYSLAAVQVETNNVLYAAAAANTIWLSGVDVELARDMTLKDWNLHANSDSTLIAGPDGEGTLTVASNGGLYINASTSLEGSLVVASGGSVTHLTGGSAESYRIDLDVSGDVTVEPGGKISATGRGYYKNQGPGASSGNNNNPGMHAGRVYQAADTKHCYGSITRPVNYGSGGGWNNASNGGGAVKLSVAGDLVNDGSIEANGDTVNYYPGAGGSVWVTASTISGSGTFTANGGRAYTDGNSYGMGSGGRVSLWLTSPGADFSAFTGYASAVGGQRSNGTVKIASHAGAPGTVYFKTGDQAYNEGLLVITNNLPSSHVTEIVANSTDAMPIDVTDTDVGTLYLGKNAKLQLENAVLALSGSWTNAVGEAAFTALEGSEVVFTNESIVSSIVGLNTFSRLTCTTPGKTILFGTGETDFTSISANGKFTVTGAEGEPVVLRGDIADTPWRLGVDEAAQIDVSFVDVAFSDASAGTKLVATDAGNSANQNNVNWQFVSIIPGATNEWTGASSKYWTDAANWSLMRAPVETDVIVVPATATAPELTTSQILNALVVRQGATLSLAGYNLVVTNSLSVAGVVECSGREVLTVAGDATFAADSFTWANSTLVITGPLDQDIDLRGCTFFDIVVRKDAGTVSFAGGLDVAGTLSFESAGPSSAVFAQGALVKCFALYVDGGDGVLTLTGPSWTLAISGACRVSDVRVGGCTASVGTIVARGGSVDLGSNVNWRFGGDFVTWVGGSGSFGEAANWSSGAVPGPDDDIVINAGASVTATDAVCVNSLEVGGGEGTSTLVARGGLDIGENLVVYSNGVVCLDAPSSVANSVVVYAGGNITHSANSSQQTYQMELDCGNVFYLEKGGFVDVTAKGYANMEGPGSGGEKPSNHAGSHGGAGCAHANMKYDSYNSPCYGSVFAPVTIGSGGANYAASEGGGAVRIFAGGEMRIDGTVRADGRSGAAYYTGAGGSIYLKGASFTGTGEISANGGNVSTDAAGGGGRIAIYQTEATDWSLWQGTQSVYGGIKISNLMDGAPSGSAGTIYMQSAADGAFGGTVTSANKGGYYRGFELPASVSSGDSLRSFRNTKFVLGSGTRMIITEDIRVDDISLDSASSGIISTNCSLGIRSHLHKDRAGWLGTVTTSPDGQVYWLSRGMSLIVR